VLSLGETYGEITPSSEGLRLFVFGSIDAAIKDDQVGVEIYDRSRFLTITGHAQRDQGGAPNAGATDDGRGDC
jgi:hypothetical protein